METKINKEIKFGCCPHCNSINYERYDTYVEDDEYRANCSCYNCNKEFTEYFVIEEVKFNDDNNNGEETLVNNSLTSIDKKILLRALDKLIDYEEDSVDYTELHTLLNGGLRLTTN